MKKYDVFLSYQEETDKKKGIYGKVPIASVWSKNKNEAIKNLNIQSEIELRTKAIKTSYKWLGIQVNNHTN